MQSATNVTEDLVRQLYRLGRVQREIARHALTELGSQGFGALGVLHLNGPQRASDVAKWLSVDLSVASRQIAALARAGYVEREVDPDDARAQRISVTDAGVAVLSESHRRTVEAFSDVMGDWSTRDVEQLTELLTRLHEDFNASAEEGSR